MVNKNSAKFIVIALFLFRPILTSRFIELVNHFETFFITVMSQTVLKQTLIEIESLHRAVLKGRRVFFHDFGQEVSTFILFLDETEYLVDFIWNNISVLIHLVA